MTRVLVVEDTLSLQTLYRGLLARTGIDVTLAANGEEARRAFEKTSPQVVCLDLGLPDCDGLELMRQLQRAEHQAQFIVITADESVHRAVELMRHGAREFLVKPFNEHRLLTAVRQAVEAANGVTARPGQMAELPAPIEDFIGSSPAMQRVSETVEAISASMAPVFVTGESGTGKEICARAVHARSPRSARPFVVLECGALRRDHLEAELFEQLQGGSNGAALHGVDGDRPLSEFTLFLDEICETEPDVQAELLHLLQTASLRLPGQARPRRVDVRPIAATAHDPLTMVQAGRLREDIYYRLRVVPIHLPPLRERGSDVLEIAGSMLNRFSQAEGRSFAGLDDEAEALFRRYDWPGNVRELRNVLWNVVLLNDGPLVTPQMLPPEMMSENLPPVERQREQQADVLEGMTLAEAERLVIERAIDRAAGSVPRAARALDVAPSTIYRKRAAWQQCSDP